jgi:tetratricopeptide (TPR) repeat protein
MRHRHLNRRLLAVLVSLFAVVGTGAYVVHRVQLRRNAHVFLERADHDAAAGDLPGAADYYARYLRLAPGDVNAWENYARVLERRAEAAGGSASAYLKAFFAYEEVLRRDDGRTEVRRQAARLALRLGRLSDAHAHLEVLTAALPKDAEARRLLGECDEALGNFQEAAEHYEQATQCDEHDILSYAKLAHVRREQLSEPDKADAAMDEMVEASEKLPVGQWSPAPYVTRAVYYMRQGEADPLAWAADDVAFAQAIDPTDPEVTVVAVTLAETTDDWSGAARLLRKGLAAHAKLARLYAELAAVQVHLKQPEDAAETLKRGVKAVPDDHDLRWELANLEVELEHAPAAAEQLARLREVESPAPPLDYLDARLLALKGEWRAAARKLEQTRGLLAEQPRWARLVGQADFWLGRCREELGETEQAYFCYDRAVSADPSSAPASLALARTLSAMGRAEEALAEYQRLSPRALNARHEIIRLMIARNVERGATDADWNNVERLLDDLGRNRLRTPELALTWADLLAARGRTEKADELLKKAAGKHDHAGLWVARAILAERAGRGGDALAILDEAGRHLKDPIDLRLARVHYWGGRNRDDNAPRGVADALRGLEKYGAADQARLMREAAAAYRNVGRPEEARRLWATLAERDPDDLTCRARLFELLLETRNVRGAEEVLGHIRRIDGGDGAVYETARAALLIARGQGGDRSGLEEAAELLAAVARRRQAWSQVPLLQARLDEVTGNAGSAIDHYRQALDLGERDPAVVLRAVQLLNDQQRFPEAEQLLARARRQGTRQAELDRLAAETAWGRRDFATARQRAEQAVGDSHDYRDWIWLGEIRRAAGDRRSAEKAFQQALALADNEPEPWVALVQFYAGTKDGRPQAEALLPRMAARLKDPALALARCHQALGRREEAGRCYREALARHPDDAVTLRNVALWFLGTKHRQEAEPLLRKLTTLGSAAPGEAAWARRALAVLLGTDGDSEGVQQARALLGGDRGAAGASDTEDQRAWAIVLSMPKDQRQRRRAAAILERLAAREVARADDLFLLAQLYDRLDQPDKARTTMLGALAREPENPGYLRFHIHQLLLQKLGRDAQPWIGRLEKLEPNEWEVVDLNARALQVAHRLPEAIALVEDKSRRPGWLGLAARLLEELGEFGKAGALYESYVKTSPRPESALVLAGFLGRRGEVDRALGLCDEAWRHCDPEVVALHALAILQARDVTAEHRARVARRLEAAERAHADRPALTRYLADLRVLQDRYDDAAALYRQVLARDPRSLTAVNNLAWLLSTKQGQHDEALRLLNQAIAEAGEQAQLLDTRALVYLAQGKSEPARRDLELAIQDNATPPLYLHLAEAHWRTKRRAEAKRALGKAESLGLAAAQLGTEDREMYRHLVAVLKTD